MSESKGPSHPALLRGSFCYAGDSPDEFFGGGLLLGFGEDAHDGLGIGTANVDPALGPINAYAVTAVQFLVRESLGHGF